MMIRNPRLAALASAFGAAILMTCNLALGAHGHAETAAHGAGAHAALDPIAKPEAGVVTGIAAIVVFLLVFAILATKVWPTISKGLDERANKIRSEIEAAELAQQQAKEALQQYEKSLAQARAEAQKMLDEAKAQQQLISADLRAKADVELSQLRDRAKRDIEAAKRAAINEIYAEATTLATSIASKILRKEIRPEDQQRLVQESLTELQGAGHG